MKRFLSVLIAALMLTTLSAFGISAEEKPQMTVSTVEANIGQTVTVNVIVSGNPGMCAASLKPVYDKTALELVEMKFNTSLFSGNVKYGVKAVWSASADNVNNGIFLTLTFKVLDNAKIGISEVTIDNTDGYLNYGAVCNRKEENIKYKVVSGGVNIIEPNPPTMTVSTENCFPGDTVTVSVSLSNNPGIMAAALKPVYDDSVLELIDMKFNTALFSGNVKYGVKAVWAASADNVNNGEFLILTFKVLDSTEGFTDVSVQYSYGDICNFNTKVVNFIVTAGGVNISKKPGDVNGDNSLDARDLSRLMRLIADDKGFDDPECINADVNGDGTVNAKDIARLMKLIAESE